MVYFLLTMVVANFVQVAIKNDLEGHSDPHRFDSLLRMQNESVGGRISK
jgi:hypothetical protein